MTSRLQMTSSVASLSSSSSSSSSSSQILLPRLAEAVVVEIMKIVDCHVDSHTIELLAAISTVSSSKFWSIFDRDGPILALQMVNFSSLHDEGRPADVFTISGVMPSLLRFK